MFEQASPAIQASLHKACDSIVFFLSTLNAALEGALLEAMIVGGSCLFFLVLSYVRPRKRKLTGVINPCPALLRPASKQAVCKPREATVYSGRNSVKKKPDEVQKLLASIANPGRSTKQALSSLERYRAVISQEGIDLGKYFTDHHHGRCFYLSLISCTMQAGVQPLLGTEAHEGCIRRLLSDMRHCGIPPNADFYASLMKMLGNENLWREVLGLRSDMTKDSIEPDSGALICLMNAAVALDESSSALRYFNSLVSLGPPSQRTYMTVLRVYCRRKDWQGAVQLVEKMESLGSAPDTLVLNQVLGLCISAGRVAVAERLLNQWEEIIDAISCNTVLKGFTQEAEFTKAESLLQRMLTKGPQPNLITFNTMMDCAFRAMQTFSVRRCDEHHQYLNDKRNTGGPRPSMISIANRPWELLEQLISFGLEPDRYTCSTIVKGMHVTGGSGEEIDRAAELLKRLGPAVLQPPDSSSASSSKDSNTRLVEVIFNTLLDICTASRDLDRMAEIFGLMQTFDVTISAVTFGTLIKAFGQAGRIERVHEVWQEMCDSSVTPTVVTYGCYIDACLRSKDLSGAERAFISMTHHGIEPNAVIYTSLIRGLASAGQPARAFTLYRGMLEASIQPTTVTFNSMIDMVARHVTDLSKVEEVLNDMTDPSIRTHVSGCDILLKASCKSGNLDNAIHVFKRLRTHGIVFDDSSFIMLLQASARADRVAEVDMVWGDMQQLRMVPPNAVASTLIKMYGRMKMPSKAEAVLEAIEKGGGDKPSLQVYTCVMQVCMQNRQFRRSLEIFDRMLHRNIEPDAITYSTVINGCMYLNRFECAMSLVRHACASRNQSPMLAKHTPPHLSVSDDCRFVVNMRPLLRPVSLQADILQTLLSAMQQNRQYALAQELSDLGATLYHSGAICKFLV